ncbi:hypothetical protein TNCV_2149861 [Trichonephila clavipes]|nr:hypothetical protein TNCV_2149861 [Trichonephila clavipes]
MEGSLNHLENVLPQKSYGRKEAKTHCLLHSVQMLWLITDTLADQNETAITSWVVLTDVLSRNISPVLPSCQVIYSQFGLAIHQNDLQARRRFVEWAQNEMAVVPDFHKRILFSDEAHFWLNGYVNKKNYHFWSEANPQVYVETMLHPEKLTIWCALWAGGILQKR